MKSEKPDPQASPLDGVLEDPSQSDESFASLDKALWDPSRKLAEFERAAEDDSTATDTKDA